MRSCSFITKYLLPCLLLAALPGASVGAGGAPEFAGYLVQVGLAGEDADPSPVDAAPDMTKACEQVSFTRSLRYGESEQNVLDVATAGSNAPPAMPRPVLLFVAGDSFSGDDSAPGAADPLQDAAMCFAARNGMVGVRITYRLAPAHPWPSGARDVAAAT